MADWKSQLGKAKKDLNTARRVIKRLPPVFNFKDHDAFNFDKALSFFDWTLKDRDVVIDFSQCQSANYQALALIVLYSWKLKSMGCRVEYSGAERQERVPEAQERGSAGAMWRRMGAQGLFNVGFNELVNFRFTEFKPLIAIRTHADFKLAMDQASEFSRDFNVEYINTLRYVISELLYNTLEHGIAFFEDAKSWNRRLPSIIQFTWYARRDEIHFLIGDLGMGVLKHLSQAYPELASDEEALRKAIEPRVSGTFGRTDPYQSKNNAGMGLFLSSNIVRRLHADMHIVSGSSVLHISPADTTTRSLEYGWPGTFALVSVRIEQQPRFELDEMMSEFREAASREQIAKSKAEAEDTFYLNVQNYFGTFPEDKAAAIAYRDRAIIPAVDSGKRLVLDFSLVSSSPHSFLNALLATPIQRMGMMAYKRIKITNATRDIRETIDFILDDNTGDAGGKLDI